jgi:hypothetical protein
MTPRRIRAPKGGLIIGVLAGVRAVLLFERSSPLDDQSGRWSA